jgi:hypothetical protein
MNGSAKGDQGQGIMLAVAIGCFLAKLVVSHPEDSLHIATIS